MVINDNNNNNNVENNSRNPKQTSLWIREKNIFVICVCFHCFIFLWPFDKLIATIAASKMNFNWIYPNSEIFQIHCGNRSHTFAIKWILCKNPSNGKGYMAKPPRLLDKYSIIIKNFYSKWKQNLKCMVDTFALMQSPSNQQQKQ